MPSKNIALQQLAWTGDAVLSLIAREWILDNTGHLDGEMYHRMTCNHFLSCFGEPTAVEARIGQKYHSDGLEAARHYILRELLPLFEKQEKKRARQHGN